MRVPVVSSWTALALDDLPRHQDRHTREYAFGRAALHLLSARQKLLKLATEIDDIFAIVITRHIRRLLDRVKIESQAHRPDPDWGRDATSFHEVLLIV